MENVEFEIADAQTAKWEPIYDYAFSRMGTQFFAAPVPAMRAIRGALKPGGKLRKICWRRKAESPMWAETEQVVQRFLSRPEEYEADTCGPGPFSLGNPETTRGSSRPRGSPEIELHQRDFDYFMGADMDEAIDSMLAIGPGAELIRLNGEYGESRRAEIAEALAGPLRRLAAARRLDRRPRVRLDRHRHQPGLAADPKNLLAAQFRSPATNREIRADADRVVIRTKRRYGSFPDA